jgi:uncharacterized protein (TIGR02145 family)
LETDARFGRFIRRTADNYDWIDGTGAVYNDRWTDGSKAAADPCPEGWRVPTHTEWASIYGTATNCSGANCYTTNPKVNKWQQDFGDTSGSPVTHGISLTPSTTNGSNENFGTSPTLFLPAGDDRNRDHAIVDNSGARFSLLV